MSYNILLIEDEDDIRLSLQEILSREGYLVGGAANGEEGLKSIIEHNPDLILCDISMPNLSGLEVLSKVREGGLASAVIMVTAHSEKERIIQALQLGAVDYVTKPFSAKELLAKVPVWLEIGKRLKQVAPGNKISDPERLQNQLRMIELFRVKNHRSSNVA